MFNSIFKCLSVYLFLTGVYTYPYFPKCSNVNNKIDLTILTTLNGHVKGACYNVTVNHGNKPPTANPVLTWLSIPYAEPPVGQLRFKKPQPVQSWTEMRDGTKWPFMCEQEYGVKANDSEDCLYLNVFVPYNVYYNSVVLGNKSFSAPIYFYVHGGKFTRGSSVEDDLEPSTMVSMSNIIVVTINYRLGVFGFLHIKDTDAVGNQAILDQNLALKWVYDNAAFFGGDNKKITIGGQSAGAWSIGYHLMFQPSWPYFRSAILESGNPLEAGSKKMLTSEKSTQLSSGMGKVLGCYSKKNNITNQELFQCIQSSGIDATKYAASLNWYYPPVVADGTNFNKDPEIAFSSGNIKPCSILTGSNSKDRAFFERSSMKNVDSYKESNLTSDISQYFAQSLYRFKVFNISTSRQLATRLIGMYRNSSYLFENPDYLDYFIQMTTDERYKCPAFALSEIYSHLNLKAYAYIYGYRISTSLFPEKYEAVHHDELAMIFAEPLSIKKPPLLDNNIWSSSKHNYSVEERSISETIVRYWTNFIKNENPNDPHTKVEWLRFNNVANKNDRNVLYLNGKQTTNLAYNINDKFCNFFNV